ncbi:putative xyloglucan endotransglucosylase/hydrolase protein 23 [Vitis vinifera]|uniref:Putative xyloglucan endotransglucosylase/hydrolase protein 23 n=1 Tax=Vitis vinifera TaxID=29760 RepID=A0A438G6L4_VITVI|nr:putative xyloglucan endotransglucosylase/hydrolase protein 23 [Vitis vinifera]
MTGQQEGGLVKTHWSQAPFTASFRSLNADACILYSGTSSCSWDSPPWLSQVLDFKDQQKMKWVEDNYMIYNYCADAGRFPQGLPTECTVT